MNMLDNKKGFVGDIIVITVILFACALIFVVMAYLIGTVETAFLEDSSVPQEAKSLISDAENRYPSAMDYFLAIMIVGLPLISASLAAILDVRNPFLWLMIFVQFVFILVGAALSNAWVEFTTGEFAATAARFPITNYVLNNFAVYVLFVGAALILGLFVRGRVQ